MKKWLKTWRFRRKIKKPLIKKFLSGEMPHIKEVIDLGKNKGFILRNKNGSEALIEPK